ncbi:MAG: acyltransferase [Candidatus Saccharibacteria bacterium]|nr:acyltransferase [Candidatus Saccharibacteria bacterium]
MQWLTGINSIRFFAIFLIVVYHLFRSFLPGGFIAVDIFFAISGFLIIGKLIRESSRGKIKYGRFILDRLLRLFPALLVCVLLTLILALFVHPDILAGMRQNTIAALTFTTNIVQLITGGSYENTISPNLFQHTWFLALEMQFYLLVPLLVMAFLNISRNHRQAIRRLSVVFIILAVVSDILLMIYGGLMGQADRAYFAIDSHMGAFCLGAAFATFNYLVPRTPRTPKFVPAIGVLLSLAIVLVLSFRLDYSNPMTYYFGLPFTGFVTIILLFCIVKLQPNVHTRHKTSNLIRVTEWLGGLSFGVYLIHYPLYLLLPNIMPAGTPVWAYALVDIIASLILAHFLNRALHVERRLKMLKYYKKRRLAYAIVIIAMIIPASISFIRIPNTSGITEQLRSMTAQEDKDIDGETIRYLGLEEFMTTAKEIITAQFKVAADSSAQPKISYGDGAKNVSSANVLVLGDSVTLGAKQALETTIPGAFVDAKESRSIITATSIIARYSAKGKLPNTIVISLATNEYNITDSLLQSIINAAGSNKTFILVTAYAGPQQPREKQNVTLKSYAAKHDNVYIADWWEIAHNDWSLMYADHIHLNPEGRITYANLVYSVIRSSGR